MPQSADHRREPSFETGTSRGELEPVYKKIALRVMPFLILLFLVAWLDRVNVGFAKLRMLSDLGFSEAVYGFGAGIFFFGYLLFEIPSNLLLEKIGARQTFARITLLWGFTSTAMVFVKTAGMFYLLRFLLGAFEAGLYPGVILILTVLVSRATSRADGGPVHDRRTGVRHSRRPDIRSDHGHHRRRPQRPRQLAVAVPA